MTERYGQFRVETGISALQIEELNRLIGFGNNQAAKTEAPFISPLLLFKHLNVYNEIPRHAPGNGLLLIHEYLAIESEAPLIPGKPMIISETLPPRNPDGSATRIDVDLLAADESLISNTKANLRSIATKAVHDLQETPLQRVAKYADLMRFETDPVPADRIEQYVLLAADSNPLHTDPDYIRASGFSGPVVPGALLVGFAEAAIAKFFGPVRVSLLRTRFTAPVTAGEPVGIAIQDRGSKNAGQKSLRLYFHRPNGNVTAIGDARIRL